MIRAMRNRTARLQALVAAVCALLSFVAVACGGSSSHGPTTATTRATGAYPNLVLPDEVAKVPADSPMHTVLAWFEAIQFRDVARVQALTAGSGVIHLSMTDLARAVKQVGPALPRPQFVASRISGSTAYVYVLLINYAPGSAQRASSAPATIVLDRAGPTWVVADVSVLFPRGAPPYGPAPRRAPGAHAGA
jgi:hypothetical protein